MKGASADDETKEYAEGDDGEGDDEEGGMEEDSAGMMAGVTGSADDPKKPAKPLADTVLGRYAKVLLSSHEFLFVR